MRVERKIVRLQLFGSLGVGGIVQQNGAKNRLFGVDVRGQSGVKGKIGDRGHIKECKADRTKSMPNLHPAKLWESGQALEIKENWQSENRLSSWETAQIPISVPERLCPES